MFYHIHCWLRASQRIVLLQSRAASKVKRHAPPRVAIMRRHSIDVPLIVIHSPLRFFLEVLFLVYYECSFKLYLCFLQYFNRGRDSVCWVSNTDSSIIPTDFSIMVWLSTAAKKNPHNPLYSSKMGCFVQTCAWFTRMKKDLHIATCINQLASF